MNVTEAILKRRSVRGYKKQSLDKVELEAVFDAARHAASNCNTQPWHVAVVSGESRDRLETLLVAAVKNGEPPANVFPDGLQGIEGLYKERQYDCAARLYGAMSIERQDREKRFAASLRNFQFFGAPHAAFISMPLSMGPVNAVDVGIYLQTLMLLMTERGIACCAQGALAFYPNQVREVVSIPKENGILCGLSFGYEDPAEPANNALMGRATLAQQLSFND